MWMWCVKFCMMVAFTDLHLFILALLGSRDSLCVRAPDLWSKGCEFQSWQRGRKIFFFRVSFVCWLFFSVHSTLMQWHVKNPGHSAKSTGGRLHLNLHTALTQQSQSGLTMPLSRHSVGTYPETSSHTTCQGTFSHSLTEPLWTDPDIKSELVCAS